jgi:hypothetical protein
MEADMSKEFVAECRRTRTIRQSPDAWTISRRHDDAADSTFSTISALDCSGDVATTRPLTMTRGRLRQHDDIGPTSAGLRAGAGDALHEKRASSRTDHAQAVRLRFPAR